MNDYAQGYNQKRTFSGNMLWLGKKRSHNKASKDAQV